MVMGRLMIKKEKKTSSKSESKKLKRSKAKKLEKKLKKTSFVPSDISPIRKNKNARVVDKAEHQLVTKKPKVRHTPSIKNKDEVEEASSESDFEQIDADWDADDQTDNDEEHNCSSISMITAYAGLSCLESSDNDLEESEEDEDEELGEEDLDALLNSNKKQMKRISGCPKEKVSNAVAVHSKSTKDAGPQPKKMKSSDECEDTSGKNDSSIDRKLPPVGWTNASLMLEEIKKRAIELSSATVYVSPIPTNVNEAMLKSLSPTMVSYRLSVKSKKKVPRGYAFLQYADMDAAEAAMKAISGRLFAGKTLVAHPNRLPFGNDLAIQNVDRNQLFVTGFSPSVPKSELIHIFPKGSVDFPLTKDGLSCGFAIIKFVNESVAMEAFLSTHKRLVRGLPIFVNYIINSSFSKDGNKQEEAARNTKSSMLEKVNKVKVSSGQGNPSEPLLTNKTSRNVNTANNSSIPSANTKVLVQQLPPEPDEETEAHSEDQSGDGSDAEEIVTTHWPERSCGSTSGTFVLNDLARRRTLVEEEEPKSPGDDSSGSEQDSDEDDDELEYDEDDEEEVDEETDEDDDNASLDENSDETSENEDDTATLKKKTAKPSPHHEGGLFSSPQPFPDEAACDENSDEEIDKELMAVIRAKRSASKSFKSSAGKRTWSYNNKQTMNHAKKNCGKKIKPQMLRVPKIKKKSKAH
uniref:RRM domain-containing protein n=1 Tax=Trichobilharzia regenti TaxID=157069 RepID=A0AA85J9U4_TRIRE|nr:unnamed protein product [Trichobilharzia regenti]